jgi:hypothetical protein
MNYNFKSIPEHASIINPPVFRQVKKIAMKNIHLKSTCLLLLAFLLFGSSLQSVSAQTLGSKLESKIDSLLLGVFKDKNGPGGEFLVAKAGKILYKKSFGKANLELDVS